MCRRLSIGVTSGTDPRRLFMSRRIFRSRNHRGFCRSNTARRAIRLTAGKLALGILSNPALCTGIILVSSHVATPPICDSKLCFARCSVHVQVPVGNPPSPGGPKACKSVCKSQLRETKKCRPQSALKADCGRHVAIRREGSCGINPPPGRPPRVWRGCSEEARRREQAPQWPARWR